MGRGGELMRVGRGWGMLWDMDVLACLLGLHFFFSFLLHHSCKFVVLSRLICLHSHGFVVKEEIEPKVSGANWGSMLRMLTVNKLIFRRKAPEQ